MGTRPLPLVNRLQEYRGIFVHRWRMVLLAWLTLAAALCAVVYFVPNTYEASTTILDYPRKVPEKYVAATVQDDSLDQLAVMQQEILSYTRSLEVIQKLGLYPQLIAAQMPDKAVSEFRRQVKIQIDRGSNSGPSAFTITFASRDAKTAASVVNELASGFILKNIDSRKQQVEGTVSFINNQLDQARSVLQQQEDQLRVFRMNHLGEMPDQMSANLQAIGQLQVQFQATSDKLAQLDEQELLIRKAPAENAGTSSNSTPSGASTLIAELSQENVRLANLLTHLTPQHPDVLESQAKIADLTARLKAEPKVAAAPAAVNREADARVQSIEEQRSRLRAEQAKFKERLDSYQTRVDAVPLRQEQLSSLTRDYNTARDHYSALLEKYYSAEMASELEEQQDVGRFEVLDPALVPMQAARPNRPVLYAASVLVAFPAAFLLALGVERLDDRIKSDYELLRIVPELDFVGTVCKISGTDHLYPRKLLGVL